MANEQHCPKHIPINDCLFIFFAMKNIKNTGEKKCTSRRCCTISPTCNENKWFFIKFIIIKNLYIYKLSYHNPKKGKCSHVRTSCRRTPDKLIQCSATLVSAASVSVDPVALHLLFICNICEKKKEHRTGKNELQQSNIVESAKAPS